MKQVRFVFFHHLYPAPPDMPSRGNRQGICNSALMNLNKGLCKNLVVDNELLLALFYQEF